jgi:polysaccharide export outer membrane protein
MRTNDNLFLRIMSGFLIACLVSGCASYENVRHGTVKHITASPVIEQQSITVPVTALDDSSLDDYKLRPNDVLNISIESALDSAPRMSAASAPGVAGAPSAGAPSAGAPSAGAPSAGQPRKIDSSGHVVLPLAGRVKVAGLTLDQARERIGEALMKFYKEPAVVVELSQPLYLLGQFKAPGVYDMDRPVNLLQGLALGHGPDSSANLRGALLVRNNKIVAADIYELLFKGDTRQNIGLRGGDTIYIPEAKGQPVFIFGAVKSPGPVPMFNGQLSLLQALSSTGFTDVSYDHRIRVIRSLSPTRGELILVDYDKMMKGEAMPFMLAEGDIVFVPKSTISNWNTALNELLPTLQAVGAVLNPFVQLKFLMDKNN